MDQCIFYFTYTTNITVDMSEGLRSGSTARTFRTAEERLVIDGLIIHEAWLVIRRPRQGRCLVHLYFMCFPRPPGASPLYIARHLELRGSLDGRLYLVGVFSSFLVF